MIVQNLATTVSTWDMIKNYGDISDAEMAHMDTLIDDSSNGITLDPNAHGAFDNFKWTLVAETVASGLEL